MPFTGKEASGDGDDTAGLCRLAVATIGAAALLAYAGAFRGPFLYDDQGSVADNPTIRSLASALRPPVGGWPVSGRPVFNFSLGLNYAISGEQTWSYHVLSLVIHVAAGLALFGVVRRTLAGCGFAGMRAAGTAWAAALLWTVHPLQTEAVTYISQRSESLMGLFYLLTLYCFIRSSEWSGNHKGWAVVAVLSCLLGMATKEVMATAPLMILLYDRVFLARSWSGVCRRRGFHFALAATWIVLAALMATGGSRGGTAGFGSAVSWWAYGVTQFRAVAHYLRLCLWPHPLIFSYGLTLGGPPWEVVWDAGLVLGLAVLSLVAAIRGSRLGYLGAWFFIVLGPSSSIVPVATELIAEHRAYLSLAAVTTLVALGGEWLARRMAARFGWGRSLAAGAAIAAVALSAVAEGAATHRRNHAYDSLLALWADTVAKSPDDAGARNNLGNALAERGRLEEAVGQYREALLLVPGYDDPHFNLGNALVKLGRPSEAIPHYQAALRVRPDDGKFLYALGVAEVKSGRTAEARAALKRAMAATAEPPEFWYNLGNTLLDVAQLEEARDAFAAAIRLRPDYADALVNHAGVLAQLNDTPRAIADFETALRLEPGAADVHNNLGGLLAESGRLEEARRQFEAAVALKPDFREARDNLERVKAMELAVPRP